MNDQPIADHETANPVQRRIEAFRLITQINAILRNGNLGMTDYPKCSHDGHRFMLFDKEHRRMKEIAEQSRPSVAELEELINRTRCNAERSSAACRRFAPSSQFYRAAQQHHRRMAELHQTATRYAARFRPRR